MVFTRWASSELQFGVLQEVVARERQGGLSREVWLGAAEAYPGTRYLASKHQIWRGRRTARPSTNQGGLLNPCARKSKVRSGKFLRRRRISDHDLFSSYEGQQGAENGQDPCGAFSRMHRALDGWILARAPASPAQRSRRHLTRYFNFPYFCMTCGLGKLGLVDQKRL